MSHFIVNTMESTIETPLTMKDVKRRVMALVKQTPACISSKGDIGGDLKTIDSADSGRGNSVLGSSTHKGTDHSSGGISGRNSNGYSSAATSPTPPHPPTPQPSMELVTLKKEVDRLRTDLHKSKEVIMKLQAKEQMLVNRLSDQARLHFERGSKFENLKMGSSRPTQLIRQYGNLYSQVRVEALDALARLSEMEDSDDLKSKVIFSVIVLAFRSVRTTIENKKTVLREILGVPPMCRSTESPVREMLESIGHYMRQTTNQYNITPNVQEVCSQLYATLFDFPSLPTCAPLTRYIEECVTIAWALSNQIPAYCIEYDIAKFNPNIHQRFHTSDPRSSDIQSYLWPALTEGENGPCVYKAIVIT